MGQRGCGNDYISDNLMEFCLSLKLKNKEDNRKIEPKTEDKENGKIVHRNVASKPDRAKATSGTSFTNTGLAANKTYYYKVRFYKHSKENYQCVLRCSQDRVLFRYSANHPCKRVVLICLPEFYFCSSGSVSAEGVLMVEPDMLIGEKGFWR